VDPNVTADVSEWIEVDRMQIIDSVLVPKPYSETKKRVHLTLKKTRRALPPNASEAAVDAAAAADATESPLDLWLSLQTTDEASRGQKRSSLLRPSMRSQSTLASRSTCSDGSTAGPVVNLDVDCICRDKSICGLAITLAYGEADSQHYREIRIPMRLRVLPGLRIKDARPLPIHPECPIPSRILDLAAGTSTDVKENFGLGVELCTFLPGNLPFDPDGEGSRISASDPAAASGRARGMLTRQSSDTFDAKFVGMLRDVVDAGLVERFRDNDSEGDAIDADELLSNFGSFAKTARQYRSFRASPSQTVLDSDLDQGLLCVTLQNESPFTLTLYPGSANEVRIPSYACVVVVVPVDRCTPPEPDASPEAVARWLVHQRVQFPWSVYIDKAAGSNTTATPREDIAETKLGLSAGASSGLGFGLSNGQGHGELSLPVPFSLNEADKKMLWESGVKLEIQVQMQNSPPSGDMVRVAPFEPLELRFGMRQTDCRPALRPEEDGNWRVSYRLSMFCTSLNEEDSLHAQQLGVVFQPIRSPGDSAHGNAASKQPVPGRLSIWGNPEITPFIKPLARPSTSRKILRPIDSKVVHGAATSTVSLAQRTKGLQADEDLLVLWSGPTRNIEVSDETSEVKASMTVLVPGRFVVGCWVEEIMTRASEALDDIDLDEVLDTESFDSMEQELDGGTVAGTETIRRRVVFCSKPLVVDVQR